MRRVGFSEPVELAFGVLRQSGAFQNLVVDVIFVVWRLRPGEYQPVVRTDLSQAIHAEWRERRDMVLFRALSVLGGKKEPVTGKMRPLAFEDGCLAFSGRVADGDERQPPFVPAAFYIHDELCRKDRERERKTIQWRLPRTNERYSR